MTSIKNSTLQKIVTALAAISRRFDQLPWKDDAATDNA
jgi:hypothetical protein